MSYTLTGGQIKKVGNYATTITVTGVTNLTFPTSGTLLTTAGASNPVWERTPISLSGGTYNVLLTDCIVGVTTLTTTSTVTLPAVGSTPVGQIFVVADESGNARSYRYISVNVSGGAHINGSATHKIQSAYGSRIFYNTGTKYAII